MAQERNPLIDPESEKIDLLTDGVKTVLENVETLTKEAKAKIDKQDDRIDAVGAQMLKLHDKQDKKLEEFGNAIAGKLDGLAKRTNPLGFAALMGEADTVKAGISEADRHLIGLAEMNLRDKVNEQGHRVVRGGRMSDPVFKAATILWLRDAAALQTRQGARNQGQIRERMEKLEAALIDAYTKAPDQLSEGANPGGGFLVPAPIESEVLRMIADNAIVRPFARVMTMTSKTAAIPQKGSAITAYWGAEEATLTMSYDTTAFASATLTAKRCHGRATSSIELMTDSIVGLGDYILTTLTEEIAILEDIECLEGAGTNHTGVIAAASVNSVATTTTDGEAAVYGDLTKTVWKARQRASRNGARWFGAPEVFGALEGMVDSNGQPIVRYGQVQEGLVRNLLGFPVESVSSLSVTITRGATGGTSNLYFGPPITIIIGDRNGMSFDVSDAPNWATYQLDMRLVKRTGIVVGVPTAWTKLVGIVTA